MTYPHINVDMHSIWWEWVILLCVDKEVIDSTVRLIEILHAGNSVSNWSIDHGWVQYHEIKVWLLLFQEIPRYNMSVSMSEYSLFGYV